MFCVKCGHENSGANKYCVSCNAVLIQMAPESTVVSGINVEEGVNYLVPERNYECRWFMDFVETASRFFNDEATLDEVKQVYQNIKTICESFDNMELPGFLNELESLRNDEFGEEYSRQLNYLLNKGFQLMSEGMQIVGASLDNLKESETFQAGLDKLQEGINQVGLAEEFIGMHLQVVEEELNKRQFENDDEGEEGAEGGEVEDGIGT